MHIVRQIVNLGHSARATASIKVRQPLAKVSIACPIDINVEMVEKYLEIILDELNVKEIEFIQELGDRVKLRYTPRSKILGPKFGRDVQDIIRMVKSGEIASLGGGKYQVGQFTLTDEDIEIGYEAKDGAGVASENGYTLLLDTTITQQLVQEGIARDVVRFVQDMRKEANYAVSDRIQLVVETDDIPTRDAVTAFADYIRRETLAEELQQSGSFSCDLKKELDLDGISITLGIFKCSL